MTFSWPFHDLFSLGCLSFEILECHTATYCHTFGKLWAICASGRLLSWVHLCPPESFGLLTSIDIWHLLSPLSGTAWTICVNAILHRSDSLFQPCHRSISTEFNQFQLPAGHCRAGEFCKCKALTIQTFSSAWHCHYAFKCIATPKVHIRLSNMIFGPGKTQLGIT